MAVVPVFFKLICWVEITPASVLNRILTTVGSRVFEPHLDSTPFISKIGPFLVSSSGGDWSISVSTFSTLNRLERFNDKWSGWLVNWNQKVKPSFDHNRVFSFHPNSYSNRNPEPQQCQCVSSETLWIHENTNDSSAGIQISCSETSADLSSRLPLTNKPGKSWGLRKNQYSVGFETYRGQTKLILIQLPVDKEGIFMIYLS